MKLAMAWVLLVATGAAAAEPAWEEKSKAKGVTVYSRDRAGTGVKEIKAVGIVDAPPQAVLNVLKDLARYRETMPYTEESRVLATEDGGKAVHFYTVINPPVVSRRDYALFIRDESDWQDGKGYLKTHWTLSQKSPAERDGVVRVKVNDGSWTLEPLENGAKTRATYLLFTDPGGSLPTWIINKANSSTIPDLFEGLRKHSRDPRYLPPKK